MPILGILFIILSSVLTGLLITGILRERNSNFAVAVSAGFLSLFALLFVCVLAGLKLDLPLRTLSLAYLGIVSLTSMAGLFFVAKKDFKLPQVGLKHELSAFYVLTVVTAVVSFVILSQSFINDDLMEIVYTSVSTDTYYEYSSLTGDRMINGLPIFNKVYVMPMFFTIVCKIFGTNPFLFATVCMPLFVYILNLCLVNQIAKETGVRNINLFMSLYLLWLVCGTYLPDFGVPVTWGYAILRSGYSGYAVFYGVLVPLAVLLLIKKKWFKAVCAIMPAVALLRIDRVFYGLKDGFVSYSHMNQAGKLAGVYFVSLLAAWALSKAKNKKTPLILMLTPGLYVVYVFSELYDSFSARKEKIMLVSGTVIVLLSCVNFTPYKGAQAEISCISWQQSVSECVSLIKADYPDARIYSTTEFMSAVRTSNGNTLTAYGRDYDSSYMLGLSYEPVSENVSDFDRDMKNQLNDFDYLVTDNTRDKIIEALADEGVNVVVFPKDFDVSGIKSYYEQAGFEYKGTYGNFSVFGMVGK